MNPPDASRHPWADRLRAAYAGPYMSPDEPNWLGMAPADEAEIRRQEQRLGRLLPPSYREFLLVSNGWDQQSFTSLHLLPIADVGWTRDVAPHLAHRWGAPLDVPAPELPIGYSFDYDAPQDPNDFELVDHVPHTLQISEDVEGRVYLLNPHVITDGGEWEAWCFDALFESGGIRLRSFWHLMERAFQGELH
ncbi:SMI1/KNR4 family protein [Streptosporangium sp. OZ121]|uniref:SMI1/KNR4 family protein n=1 Tax=Streptosporangium sp. OZ121 TaxID=3444183 RepID=UPI003F78D175